GWLQPAQPGLKELLGFVRLGRRLENPACAAAEIVHVDAALLRLLGDPLGEVERLVEDLGPSGRVLAHLVQDRALGPGGDDRVVDPFDPGGRRATVPAGVVGDRLDSVDLVGPRILAEAEEDHPVAVGHGPSIAVPSDHSLLVTPARPPPLGGAGPASLVVDATAEGASCGSRNRDDCGNSTDSAAAKLATPRPQAYPIAPHKTSATRSCSSTSICVKNGSASVREHASSAIGNIPSRKP